VTPSLALATLPACQVTRRRGGRSDGRRDATARLVGGPAVRLHRRASCAGDPQPGDGLECRCARRLGVYPGRAQRALDNFKETYPAFIALALALQVTGHTGGNGALGAWLWFGGRVVYLPLYLFGVPVIRTAVYGVTLAGLVMMLTRLF
jgi:uncharacterized MAPEG superfamily protein